MDDHRFDALARSFSSPGTRRGVIGGLLIGSLSLLGLAEAGEKAKRKKKHKKKTRQQTPSAPPPVTCTPNCNDRTCGADGCGGSCGTCSGGKLCQGGLCACPSGQQDSGGVCGTDQVCYGFDQPCVLGSECCGGTCSPAACAKGSVGRPCHVTNDCAAPLSCRSFVCTA